MRDDCFEAIEIRAENVERSVEPDPLGDSSCPQSVRPVAGGLREKAVKPRNLARRFLAAIYYNILDFFARVLASVDVELPTD